jgi:uncharacterized protein with HEPN domain
MSTAFRFDPVESPPEVLGRPKCTRFIAAASRRLPGELKARYPAIAWREMAGAGNVYRHDYEDVALSYVWTTLRNDLPPFAP